MTPLLNLLAAVALLVWGTHTVRSAMLRAFGENLSRVLAASFGHRGAALGAGLAVTGLVQSSTATALLVGSFVGRGAVPLAGALAAMLGADIGTALIAGVFSLDLSALSPLALVAGVALFVGREETTAGRIGRVLIGLGLITLALQLIVGATRPLLESALLRLLLAALPDDGLFDLLLGAALTIGACSSLATVLLVAALSAEQALPAAVALGLVLGANLGSGALAVFATARAGTEVRRLPLAHAAMKALGVACALPLLGPVQAALAAGGLSPAQQVVAFHLGFNALLALAFIGFTEPLARLATRWLPAPPPAPAGDLERPRHLDPVALATPSLAIACAAREALHQADVVEQMMRALPRILRDDDLALAARVHRLDDTVDALYSAIKLYLTRIPLEALTARESRRWADVVGFTIVMEQAGDGIERIVQDLEDKKIRPRRRFSDAGAAEIGHLIERLTANLRLAAGVFLDGHPRDAERLLEEKRIFRDLQEACAAQHLARLHARSRPSLETSALHLDLIAELRRINSRLCSIAWPVLEAGAGAAAAHAGDAAAAAAAAASAPAGAAGAAGSSPTTAVAGGRGGAGR